MESKGEMSEESKAELMRWANTTKEHVEAVRNGAFPVPGGQTKDFYIKKYLLLQITGDDLQAFSFMGDFFIQEQAPAHKQVALIRLDFEIEQPELPENVRAELSKVRGQITEAEVSTKNDYFAARNKYKEAINKIKRIVEKDKSLGMTFVA